MSLFRKAGRDITRAFRKAPRVINVFARKLSNTATQVASGLNTAEDAINRAVPANPITKAVSGVLQGGAGVADGIATAGNGGRSIAGGNTDTGLRQLGMLGIKEQVV